MGGLSPTDYHRLLAAKQRRIAMDVLAEHRFPVDVTELAREIAVQDCDGETVDKRTVGRITTTLHHKHLPLMADLGVIEYDPATNRVESSQKSLELLTT